MGKTTVENMPTTLGWAESSAQYLADYNIEKDIRQAYLDRYDIKQFVKYIHVDDIILFKKMKDSVLITGEEGKLYCVEGSVAQLASALNKRFVNEDSDLDVFFVRLPYYEIYINISKIVSVDDCFVNFMELSIPFYKKTMNTARIGYKKFLEKTIGKTL